MYEALSYWCRRVYEAFGYLSYSCMRPSATATSVCGLKLLVYEALSY